MFAKPMVVSILLALSSSVALAGPCDTTRHDAGSGPVTTGKASETTGTASTNTKEHPPTAAMNKASENTATSSEDAQRQMQGEPTAAEQSQKKTVGTADKGC